MHDPMVVAHEIVRPWPTRSGWHDAKPGQPRWSLGRMHHTHFGDDPAKCSGCGRPQDEKSKWFPWWRPHSYSRFWTLAGRGYYWPALITVWHNEPGDRDSGEVCKHSYRWQDQDGWHSKPRRAWRWHVHHWSIQVHPWQQFKRWAFTRCAWCGGRSTKRNGQVNCSMHWDGPRPKHWWQGEPELFHGNCSSVYSAHQACLCAQPFFENEHTDYGRCKACGRFRSWGKSKEALAAERLTVNLVPLGKRPSREAWEQITAAWAKYRVVAEAEEAAKAGRDA